MSSEPKSDEVPPQPKSLKARQVRWWWCAPILVVFLFGVVAIGGAIYIFLGLTLEGADWGYYYLNVIGFIAGVAYLWTEWRKRNTNDS